MCFSVHSRTRPRHGRRRRELSEQAGRRGRGGEGRRGAGLGGGCGSNYHNVGRSCTTSAHAAHRLRTPSPPEEPYAHGNMPFHGHHHQNSAFTPSQGLGQAAQALGSIGAPAGNLRVATSGTTNAGTDALMPGSGNVQSPASSGPHAGGHTAPPAAGGLSHPPPQQQARSFEPRRAATNEELHINTMQSQAVAAMYNSPGEYGAPNASLHQAAPNSQYSSAPPVPGSLQAGAQQQQQRPGAAPAYSAPSAVPAIPQITTVNSNSQQYTLPTRTMSQNQPQHSSSHTYSRSSPAGLGPDQKYIPFSNTPESSKYAAGTPAQKYYPSTPSGAASNSPLGLADIRPRANSNMGEEATGAGTLFVENDRTPSNSSYLTPWPAYAFDWCKWNVHGGNGAGKMAVGSYLEDTHNFVRQHQDPTRRLGS